MASIKEYWRIYLWRDMVLKLVTVNMAVWIVIAIGTLVCNASGLNAREWIGLFTLPARLAEVPGRLWTVITYMFVQTDFVHLVVNMMWLMLFGRFFMQMQGEERLLAVYVYGGIAGAAAFLAWASLVGSGNVMMYGASCSVLALCGAVAVLAPDARVDLMFFGSVKMIWIALACVLFFVILAESADQSAAHAGGLVLGVAYALCRRRGVDITAPAVSLIRRAVNLRTPVARNISGGASASAAEHRELDELLSKVSRSGYNSLDYRERQRLFELSQKIRR